MSKAENTLKLLEQTDTVNDYFDQWQSYFSPSDWQKITSLLKRTIGIPFYQFKNPVSDDMMNVLTKQNVPGSAIGQATYFFYWSGVQNSRPYVVGGFGDASEEPPKYLLVRKNDQIKWQEEFGGQLEDYNRLNLPTQDFPPALKVSIGEPVGGHDKRSQETVSLKSDELVRGDYVKTKSYGEGYIITTIPNGYRIAVNKRTPWDKATKINFYDVISVQKNGKGPFVPVEKSDESTGIAAGGSGKPVHAFSGTVNYLPKRAEENKMKEKKTGRRFYRIVDLDERGMYHAHVEDEDGKEVFSYSNENEEEQEILDDDGEPTGEYETVKEYGDLYLVTDGYMKHTDDLAGLEDYLIDMKVIPKDATLYDMRDQSRHEQEPDYDDEEEEESFESKAMKIFASLREAEDGYGKVQDVVFIQGEEADEPLKILDDEGIEAAADYLAQWDNGDGEFIDFPAGDADDVEEVGEYIVMWNDGLGYIGMVKKISPELRRRYGVEEK